MKISILMPAYNAMPYIEEAIKSILSQTYQDWELIVVDDNSSDDTVRVVREYQTMDRRIRLIQRKENSGCAFFPRIEAADAAGGLWVCPVDADDTIAPDYLEKMVERQKATSADLILGEMWSLESDRSALLVPVEDFDSNQVYTGRELVAETLYTWRIGANGMFCNKDLYIESSRYFESFRSRPSVYLANIDEVMTRDILIRAMKVAFTNVRYNYRTNQLSITQRPSAKAFGFMYADEYLEEIIDSHFEPDSETWRRMKKQAFCHIVDAIYLQIKMPLDKEVNDFVSSEISERVARLDLAQLKGIVSRNMLAIMKMGMPIGKWLMIIYIRILKFIGR